MVLIYTTCKDTGSAVKMGMEILNERLASAVNLWPMQSIRRTHDKEIVSELGAGIFIKTMEPRIADIEELVTKFHGTTMPYIGAIDIRRFNRDYREWMASVVKE
jgi:uncharacterized protein involved in tolerance to divalent cations